MSDWIKMREQGIQEGIHETELQRKLSQTKHLV